VQECDFCVGSIITHSDDYVRVILAKDKLWRPAYACAVCLHMFMKCHRCRWFDVDSNKCVQSPFKISKEETDGCGQWKQDVPVLVRAIDKDPNGAKTANFEVVGPWPGGNRRKR